MKPNFHNQRAVASTAAAAIDLTDPARLGQLLQGSVRAPVTDGTRAYLRALRAAESAAWEPILEVRREAELQADRSLLRAQMAQLARDKRKETWLYSILAGTSAIAVGYAIWDSFRMFENWPTLLNWFGLI